MALRKPSDYNTLMRVRKRQEELCAQALAAAQRKVHAAQRQHDAYTQAQRDTLTEADGLLRKTFDAQEIRLYYQYERHLASLAGNKALEVRQLAVKADEQRKVLEQALQQRRMVERLQEKCRERVETEFRTMEQKLTDEVGANYAAHAEARHDSTEHPSKG